MCNTVCLMQFIIIRDSFINNVFKIKTAIIGENFKKLNAYFKNQDLTLGESFNKAVLL